MIAELEAANSGKVWFSKIGDQNDPFDTNPHFVDSSLNEVKKFLYDFRKRAGKWATFNSDNILDESRRAGIKKSKAKRIFSNTSFFRDITRKAFHDYRVNSLISCFTEEPLNILMWSYYSNSHTSFSLGFSLSGEHPDGFKAVADVRYVEERPQLTTVDMMRRMAQQKFPDVYSEDDYDRERVNNATLLCKSTHWSHEKEWRGLKIPEVGVGYHSIKPYKLDSVIFGAKCDRKLIEQVDSVLPSNIQFLQCNLMKHTYALEMVPIERISPSETA